MRMALFSGADSHGEPGVIETDTILAASGGRVLDFAAQLEGGPLALVRAGQPAFPGMRNMPIAVRIASLNLLFGLIITLPGCGYKVQSSTRDLPAGIRSLGIPTFTNLTSQYRIEQRVTSAVLKEFTERTRIPVNSKNTGVDAVLSGEIRLISSSPVTYAADAYGSAFVVTVQAAVKLVRTSDSAVLWENPGFLFTERYVLTSTVTNYFPEEGPALDRLSRDFASSLASTVLSR